MEDKKTNEYTKTKQSGEDKLTALKNFRRSKGLCFKCGEKWGPNHKCPTSISLNAIEDIWKCIIDHDDVSPTSLEDDSDSGEDLMAISAHALNGIEGSRTIRLRGYLQGKEVFMLIDSGSSISFVSDLVAANVSPWQLLPQPVKVRVANGEILSRTHELHNQIGGSHGYTFCTTLKIIPLRGYDIILGMDWLETHSPMKIHWVDRWLQF